MITLEHFPADIFGLPDLAREALSGRLEVEGLRIARHAHEIPLPEDPFLPDERAHLSKWLEAKVSTYAPHVAVLDAVRSLAVPGSSCVVCSHRPGFLTSPLVILWKALQTVKLAQVLSESWSAPVIPVFWNRADEHDVAAVHHCHLLNRNFDIQKLNVSGLSSGRMPFSQLVLTDEGHGLGAVRALLRQIHGDHVFVDEALELFVPRGGETLAGAFSRTMYELLGHTGLVVLEPDWLREELSRALAEVVSRPLRAELGDSAAALSRGGFDPPVCLERAALVYRVDAGGRRALHPGGDGYRYDDEPGSRTATELAAEIVEEPAAFSAGASLAPLVADRVLPVAAELGGHETLALRALLAPIGARARSPMPPFVPRASITLVEPECRLAAIRLSASLLEVLSARGEWEPSAAPTDDRGLVERLREIGRRARRELLEHRDELAETDRTLGVLVRRSADQLDHTVKKLCDKVARVQANRAGTGRRYQRQLNHALCPLGRPQEEVFGAFPLVARFGRGWIDEILAELDPLAGEHLIVHLHPEDPEAGAPETSSAP